MEEQKYMFMTEETSKAIEQQLPPEEIVYDLADLY